MRKSQKRENALEKELQIYTGTKYIIRKMRILVVP